VNSVSHLKEEHDLRGIKNRVVRRIFRPQKEEATGGWERLQNEELHIYVLQQYYLGAQRKK
jgi:hypothetical protein